MEYGKLPVSTESVVDKLIGETDGADMAEYMRNLQELYRDTLEGQTLFGVSRFLETNDETDGIDFTFPVATAFMNGALVGIHVARQTLENRLKPQLGLAVNTSIERITSETLSGDDLFTRSRFADNVFEISAEKYQTLTSYHRLFEPLVHRIVPETSHSIFAKWGFAFVIDALDSVIEDDQIMREFTSVVRGEMDPWDEDLRKLTGQ